MAPGHPCEFSLVRYVPDPIKGEFVNIGVLLRDLSSEGSSPYFLRFTQDWSRVRCFDPDADIEMLESLGAELARELEEHKADHPYIVRLLEDALSNGVERSEARACLADTIPAQLEQLMQLYVESRRREPLSRVSGRQKIAQAMRSEFERAGVWNLMNKRIAASRYTHPGDTLRIDCGYRPNGVIRMFHAVSLDGDINLAKVLAFGMPKLREGVERVEHAKLDLTAIVEPWEQIAGRSAESSAAESWEQYQFGLESMQNAQIHVVTTQTMAMAADRARHEMKI